MSDTHGDLMDCVDGPLEGERRRITGIPFENASVQLSRSGVAYEYKTVGNELHFVRTLAAADAVTTLPDEELDKIERAAKESIAKHGSQHTSGFAADAARLVAEVRRLRAGFQQFDLAPWFDSKVVGAKRRAAYCTTHEDLAWEYDDGSVQCMYDLVVETRCDDHKLTPLRAGSVSEYQQIGWQNEVGSYIPLWQNERDDVYRDSPLWVPVWVRKEDAT